MTDTIIPASSQDSAGVDLSHYAYAGFWERFAALLVDFLIIVVAWFVVLIPLNIAIGVGQLILWPMSSFVVGMDPDLILLCDLKMQILTWLYFAFMESSSLQATLGKKFMGLKVMTEDGKRVSFWRATGRYFGKIVSAAIWMLGFIMAAFTAKKQALHDLMAGTVVMKKKA